MVQDLISIAIAAIAYLLVGLLWYSPKVFGNYWLRLMEKGEHEVRSQRTVYVFTIVSALVLSSILFIILDLARATSVAEGAVIGLLVSIAIVATTLPIYLYEGHHVMFHVLYSGYQVIAVTLMGMLLML